MFSRPASLSLEERESAVLRFPWISSSFGRFDVSALWLSLNISQNDVMISKRRTEFTPRREPYSSCWLWLKRGIVAMATIKVAGLTLGPAQVKASLSKAPTTRSER